MEHANVNAATRTKVKRIQVSEKNLNESAVRLLAQGLVSTEVLYVQHVLGATATQQEIDEKVMAVRKMKWSSIVLAE